MIKMVLKFLLFSISSLFLITTAFPQTVEVQGFVPNKRQFSGKGVLGQFCGAETIFHLTDTGISFELVIETSGSDGTNSYLYKFPAKHQIKVSGSNLISFDSIELYDSSSNTLNYYLPHCEDGILDVRAYKKIVIKSILPGIDWEIKYNNFDETIPFSHKFIQLDATMPNSNIILEIKADRSLDTVIYKLDDSGDLVLDLFPKNTIINLKDTLKVNIKYDLLHRQYSYVDGSYYKYKYYGLWNERNIIDYSDISDKYYKADLTLLWNVDWVTHYNYSSTKYYPNSGTSLSIPPYINALDHVESSVDISGIRNSTTDNNGNYYITGATILNAQERSARDSVNYYTEAFISKYDKKGKLLWTTFYGSSLSDIATTININSKNDIYLSGHINLHPLKDDLQKMSLDSNYKPPLWKNDFPTTEKNNDDSYFSDTIGSLFILKFDTNGKRQWARLIGKDYGKIYDKFYMIDCEFFTSAISSTDDIYFSGTYRPSLFRKKANDELPSIAIREQAMGLPIKGDTNSTWTMNDINAAAPDRFSGTNQWNVYPFILKLDSNDNLVWSTYFFTTQPIAGMAIDSKDNLYIGGNSIEGALPVMEKADSFYNGVSLFKEGNIDLPILDMERRAYIAEFDKNNKLTWCTYLEKKADNKNTITVINDIDIGIYDNLLLTGYTTNTQFPLQRKGNAYFRNRIELDPYEAETPKQNTFIMEFDSNRNLQWSTLYILDTFTYNEFENMYKYQKGNSLGLDIDAMIDGGIFIALSGNIDNDFHKKNYKKHENDGDLRVLEFDRNYNLESNNYAGVLFADHGNKILDRDIVIDDFSFEKYDNYKDVKRLYNLPYSTINLKNSSRGRAYISGVSNSKILVPVDFTNIFNRLVIYDTTTFFADGSYAINFLDLHSDHFLNQSEVFGLSFIISKSLCDSIGTFTFPFKDTLICVGTEINIPFSIDDTIAFSQHEFSWYKNNEQVSEGKDYTITDTGIYYFIALNVYDDCPDYYSDTVSVTYIYDTIDLNFREDTIPLCVGENNYVISAYSLGATYLWSDSTTDSTYTIRYKGDSIVIIWCEVRNICGAIDRDSVTVRFYPPYAYLGEDTVLCKGQVLNFDASILNKSIPAVLGYRWILNGDTIDGTGANNELFTITEKDSGQLILHAIWPGSDCEEGIDTLNFAYYQFDNVGFYLPTDTSICFYEKLEIDLIQTLEPNTDTNNIYLCLSSTGDTISTESSFTLKDTISYYILASNYCSKQKDTLKLSYFNNFNIEMLQPTDTAICQELFPTEIYGLTTEQIDGICYWLSENKEDTIEIGPSRYINQDGTYPITLSDIYNCSQDYDIIVSLKEDCSPQIDMPNVFTPNSDGVNDFFKIISADNVKDFKITIFNKAGTKVYDYEGLIENFAWNGCYKNSARDVPEGAYFFVILYKDVTNVTRKQAGTLTLLR